MALDFGARGVTFGATGAGAMREQVGDISQARQRGGDISRVGQPGAGVTAHASPDQR